MFSPCLNTRYARLLTASVASFVVFLTTTSCIDEVETPYAQRPAFFRFSPVTAAPKTLLPALNNPGEWCTVTRNATHYVFTSATASSAQNGGQHFTDTYPLTQLDQYGSVVWVSGLIVGTPAIPELGTNGFAPAVFDLACPSCFETGAIMRNLTISLDSHATCSRCHRSYDLQNGGIIVSGASAPYEPRLFRYHCTYSNDSFVVRN